eukprot:TRINITY_DN5659_c0_g1_i2.p1 TRINITY_DN5659_c0_g1~~TRINITY_DN5659_c0_g1_i2.p1  ORF type:complete len:136 (+),score=26.30 TRINITY_DN5659_c0_g1_i2:110-517(+)
MSITIKDAYHNTRATITEDGEVLTDGKLVGFIEPNGSCGDADQNFLGEINESGQISDGKEKLVGSLDESKGEFRDDLLCFVGDVRRDGEICDNFGSHAGKADNFDYSSLRKLAAYLFFFDYALLKDGSPSLILGS